MSNNKIIINHQQLMEGQTKPKHVNPAKNSGSIRPNVNEWDEIDLLLPHGVAGTLAPSTKTKTILTPDLQCDVEWIIKVFFEGNAIKIMGIRRI